MPSPSSLVLELADLSLIYGHNIAIEKIQWSIGRGDMWAIIGPNGGGKSTILKCICGLLRPTQGSIRTPIPSRISYLGQSFTADLSFPLTVLEAAAIGLYEQIGPFKAYSDAHIHKILESLKMVGLYPYKNSSLERLSGGQIQRLLFARLFLQQGQVILLDEPFANIDPGTVDDLMRLLLIWQKEGKTILVVTHDLDLVRRYFPQTLIVSQHVIDAGPTPKVLCKKNLFKARLFHPSISSMLPDPQEENT